MFKNLWNVTKLEMGLKFLCLSARMQIIQEDTHKHVCQTEAQAQMNA